MIFSHSSHFSHRLANLDHFRSFSENALFSDETGRCFNLKLTIIRKSSIMSGGLFSSLFGGIHMRHGGVYGIKRSEEGADKDLECLSLIWLIS